MASKTATTDTGATAGGDFSFELPGRREDVPKPGSKTSRRLETPASGVWFDVVGGGSQAEAAFISWNRDQLVRAGQRFARANERYARGEIDDRAMDAAIAERNAVEFDFNARLATFLADRVIAHNLLDDDGDPLPTGLGLFWAMGATDALRLVYRIHSRESIWSDPKAEKPSTNG